MKALPLFMALASASISSMMLPATASAQNSEAFLNQSYTLSQKLSGSERLFYLTELTRVSAQINLPAEKAEGWCLELFRLASATENQQLRIAGQKNALTHLSYFNPALAMQLLPEVEIQRPSPGKMLYEDLRADAAEEIFVNFLVKIQPRGLSTITAQSRYIGQTGQYPYRAMASVIEHLPQSSTGEVSTILNDALGFYEYETEFANRDEEFLVLLQRLNALKSSAVDKNLMAEALGIFVNRLTNDGIQIPGKYYSEIHTSNGAIVSFTDRNQAFLFQAFPAIRRFNPVLATQLSHAHPELDQATDSISYISGGFVMGNPTPEQASRQHIQWLQESIVARIKERSDCDPQSAAKLAQRLTDVSARVVGFSSTVPGIARKNLSEARRIYDVQIAELGNLYDPPEKLRAMVALAQAAYQVGDLQHYETLSATAHDIGVELFNSDFKNQPTLRVQRHGGFDELHKLVTFTASQPADNLKARIQRLPGDWLKAYLLLYEAEGHAKSTATPDVPAKCPD